MKRWILPIITLFLLLSGCGKEPESSIDGFDLYYPRAGGSFGIDQSVLGTESIELASSETYLEDVVDKLLSGPSDAENLYSPFAAGTELIEWNIIQETVTIKMSSHYGELQGIEMTLANASIVFTLEQFSNVSSVIITWEGQADGVVSRVLSSDSFDLGIQSGTPVERLIKLYFTDDGGRYLVPESQTLVIDQSQSVERVVMEELIRGPRNEEHRQLIPEGTELLDVYTERTVCYVNFTEEFYEGRPEDPVRERLLLYSIVDSLTELSGIGGVQILVNGQVLEVYSFTDISAPLAREELLLLPEETQSAVDLNVYIRRDGDDYVTLLPQTARRSEYTSDMQLAAEALINLEMPQGCSELYHEGTGILSIALRSGVCYIDLSEDFLRVGDEIFVYSVYALVATLTDIGGVESVQLLFNGETAEDTPVDVSRPIERSDVRIG